MRLIMYGMFILALLGTTHARAQSSNSSLNLTLPSPVQNYQSDKFRAGDLDCSNAIGSATNLEFGTTGLIKNGNDTFGSPDVDDVGIYARIVIPLGARAKNRIDCSKLYELELIKKRLEVEKLQREIARLKSLQFEN